MHGRAKPWLEAGLWLRRLGRGQAPPLGPAARSQEPEGTPAGPQCSPQHRPSGSRGHWRPGPGVQGPHSECWASSAMSSPRRPATHTPVAAGAPSGQLCWPHPPPLPPGTFCPRLGVQSTSPSAATPASLLLALNTWCPSMCHLLVPILVPAGPVPHQTRHFFWSPRTPAALCCTERCPGRCDRRVSRPAPQRTAQPPSGRDHSPVCGSPLCLGDTSHGPCISLSPPPLSRAVCLPGKDHMPPARTHTRLTPGTGPQ